MSTRVRYAVVFLVMIIVGVLFYSRCNGDELDILNKQRAQRGLYALKSDPELERLADERLALNVQRGKWGHYIRNRKFVGPVPRGHFVEGAGNTFGPDRIYCCSMYTRRHTKAGLSMVRVGNRWWQLLLVQ